MSVARHTFWSFVGVGGQQLLRFVAVIVLARLLTPAEFGVIAGAQVFTGLADGLLNFGIGTALVQAKELDREIERGAMTVVALSSAMIALILFCARSAIATSMGIPEIALVLPWLAAGLFVQGITGPILLLMYREFRFREAAAIPLLSYALGYGLVSITLALMGWSYWSIVAGSLAQTAIQFVGSFLLRPVGFALRPNWRRLRHVLHYGVGVLMGTILNNLARKGDNWVAGRMFGVAALGFYSRGYAIMDLANQVPGIIFRRVLLPHFSRTAQDPADRDRAIRQFYSAHVAAAALAMPATVAMVLLSREIVLILLGPNWTPVIPILGVLGAGIYFRLAYKVSAVLTLATGGVWQTVTRQGGYAVIVVGGSLWAAQFGLQGIAWAVLAALAWQFWALTHLAFRSVDGSWGDLGAALLPVILASAAAAGCGTVTYYLVELQSGIWLRLVVIGLSIAMPYFIVLWLLRRTPQVAQMVGLLHSLLPSQREKAYRAQGS